jgi:hypothetical protein
VSTFANGPGGTKRAMVFKLLKKVP